MVIFVMLFNLRISSVSVFDFSIEVILEAIMDSIIGIFVFCWGYWYMNLILLKNHSGIIINVELFLPEYY